MMISSEINKNDKAHYFNIDLINVDVNDELLGLEGYSTPRSSV